MAEYRARDEHEDLERDRLAVLSTAADRGTARTLTELGIGPGWACLEVGAGNGSMARWMAGAVGRDGRVVAIDIDDRFVDAGEGVEFRVHDITDESPERDAFDLVHARAVLEHLPDRDRALTHMIDATRSGGLIVVHDIDWTHFDAQDLPEPFANAHWALRSAATAGYGYDPHLGGRLHRWLADAGLRDVDARAKVSLMRGGSPSAEWYVAAVERALPRLVESGAVSQADADAALAIGRDPSFVVQSPVQVTAWGRRS